MTTEFTSLNLRDELMQAITELGYSTPTPFGTPSEVDDAQICQWAHDVLEEAGRFEQVILMVHTPPRGEVVDRLPSGVHVGSPGLRALIEKYQPAIVVTGHIHEGAGEEWIGRSHVLNPGAFAQVMRRHNRKLFRAARSILRDL